MVATMAFMHSLALLALVVFVFFVAYYATYEPYRALYPDLLESRSPDAGRARKHCFAAPRREPR
jgi:hypothetical protein